VEQAISRCIFEHLEIIDSRVLVEYFFEYFLAKEKQRKFAKILETYSKNGNVKYQDVINLEKITPLKPRFKPPILREYFKNNITGPLHHTDHM
jgi:hypothetical protein